MKIKLTNKTKALMGIKKAMVSIDDIIVIDLEKGYFDEVVNYAFASDDTVMGKAFFYNKAGRNNILSDYQDDYQSGKMSDNDKAVYEAIENSNTTWVLIFFH